MSDHHHVVILPDRYGWLIASHGDEPWTPDCPVEGYLNNAPNLMKPGHYEVQAYQDGAVGGIRFRKAPIRPIPAAVKLRQIVGLEAAMIDAEKVPE